MPVVLANQYDSIFEAWILQARSGKKNLPSKFMNLHNSLLSVILMTGRPQL